MSYRRVLNGGKDTPAPPNSWLMQVMQECQFCVVPGHPSGSFGRGKRCQKRPR